MATVTQGAHTMTEQAGSSNKPEEPSGPPPWERKWNDVKETVGKAVDAVVDTTKKAVGSVQMPWERSWGGSIPTVPKAAPRAVTGPIDTEAKMKVAAQFTPAEVKQRAIDMRSPETLAELRAEIARAKDPKIKTTLVNELNKLMGEK